MMFDFKGVKKSTLETLYDVLGDKNTNNNTNLFDKMSSQESAEYEKMVGFFLKKQIADLNNHYYFYYNFKETDNLTREEKNPFVESWMKHNINN